MSDDEASIKANGKVKSKITTKSLLNWNKYLAVIYAFQGVLLLVVSNTRLYPITATYTGIDTLQTQAQGRIVLAGGLQQLFEVNIAYLVAAIFFMAAIAQALIVTKLKNTYEKDLRNGINKIRWIEYVFSMGTMMIVVALVAGVQDISTLLVLFGLIATVNLFGLLGELYARSTKNFGWLVHLISCVSGLLPWVVVGIYLIGSSLYGTRAPAYAYWIFATIFICFCGFQAIAYLRYRKVSNWSNHFYSERAYMILSLVAKTALAWQVFAWVLRP